MSGGVPGGTLPKASCSCQGKVGNRGSTRGGKLLNAEEVQGGIAEETQLENELKKRCNLGPGKESAAVSEDSPLRVV